MTTKYLSVIMFAAMAAIFVTMPSQLQTQGQQLEDIIPKQQLDQLEHLTQQTQQQQKQQEQAKQESLASINDLNRLDAIVANITTMEDLDRMKACGVDYIGMTTEAGDVLKCWEAGEGGDSSNNND